MSNEIKAILFDMDGVLIDAKDWHYEALNKAIGLFGLEINYYDHLRTFDGLPTREKLKILSARYFLPERLHPLLNQLKQSYIMDYIYQRCHPTFQHEYALSKLHDEGYKIAVCSNSIRKTIELMMERAELMPFLDLIISNEDVTQAKPAPECYIMAMQKLFVQPQECIVVEDNPIGVVAGKASGAYVLQVATTMDVNYENIIRKIEECENV